MALPQAVLNFITAVEAFNTANEASIADLDSDITELNRIITELQNSSGTVTPEDQALIDAAQAKGQELVDRLAVVAGRTPPTPPPA